MTQSDSYTPNKLVAFIGLTKASLLSSLRNPTSVFFNFFFPFIFISIFGVLGQGTQSYTVAVRPQSAQDVQFIDMLADIDSIALTRDLVNADIDEQLKKGQLPAALTVTATPQPNLMPPVQYEVKLDKSAADPQNAQVVATIIKSVADTINNPPGQIDDNLVVVNENIVEGRKFQQIDFILPGQLAFALLTNALFGISFTLMSLRKELVLKRIFAAPIPNWVLLLAEATSKLIIAIAQALLIVLVGHYLFDFVLANGAITVLHLVILSVIGIFTFLAFGVMVPSIAKDENAISPIANLIMMPQLFLSGAFFPIEAFPDFLQPIAQVLPMTFLNDAFRKVAFEGAALVETAPEVGGLLIWAVVLYLIDIKLFKWE